MGGGFDQGAGQCEVGCPRQLKSQAGQEHGRGAPGQPPMMEVTPDHSHCANFSRYDGPVLSQGGEAWRSGYATVVLAFRLRSGSRPLGLFNLSAIFAPAFPLSRPHLAGLLAINDAASMNRNI